MADDPHTPRVSPEKQADYDLMTEALHKIGWDYEAVACAVMEPSLAWFCFESDRNFQRQNPETVAAILRLMNNAPPSAQAGRRSADILPFRPKHVPGNGPPHPARIGRFDDIP